jgi:hypothetical protein
MTSTSGALFQCSFSLLVVRLRAVFCATLSLISTSFLCSSPNDFLFVKYFDVLGSEVLTVVTMKS